MEEKQDDLDNLIIQSKKPSALKKVLLAAAVLLLVLILIILVTKSLIESDQTAQSSVILPPEPVTQPEAPAKEPLFEQVPIEEEKADGEKIERVISKLKERAPEQPEATEKPPAVKVPAAAEPKAETVPAEAPETAPKTTRPPKSSAPAVSKGDYFIQVGAFFRYPPDKRFLGSIEKEGLSYRIVEGTKSGKPYKKVLVGPYPSREAAKKDLARIKKRINQNAYITKKR
ncbi:SPOR domain-containing protein [Hydrogenimonas sp.]